MKIAVLYGGISGEREVSLASGNGIMNALKQKGHDVVGIDFNPYKLDEIIKLEVDLVFIGLHGKYGEDGRIQGLLDMLNIPYVGSGVLASALAMDKAKAKNIFEMNHIPVAKSNVFRLTNKMDITTIVQEIENSFTLPFVIKPNREGSTLGLSIIQDKSDITQAVQNALSSDDTILAEDFIKGRELTVPVLGEVGHEKALPIIEIIPKNAFYDYESKYAPGGSEHIVPAPMDDSLAKQIQEYAVLAHQSLGCEIYSRVDFILSENNTPIILEVNTLPGMTPTSLFPDSAKAVHMSYEEMVDTFVTLSLKNR
ncbi:D-alanine--D-alanine ligase family protein [Oceanobacillus chungangensis]|uniref:D-alanine--D-alanine ligase n=1 Tax=Oceanobacillus chungangensis TaxID=1229152 RepID=A0A3D8Q0Q8_9BACI|nr:D-alanine--D-alanine ligase [Oceanobacillus chungangensis]RDW22026.1 D-alanine--D-alanine ligase [Oceanobacillus chungangensis]